MSSGLMDTVAGGEGDNYEDAIDTQQRPHKKSGGQMGNPETAVDYSPAAQKEANAEAGAKSAEKIRYGQTMSEQGMGGMTNSSTGEANQEVGYGGAQDNGSATEMGGDEQGVDDRLAQGLGGERDMNREVGA
ncbi:hypothetical protein MBLNU457_4843t1 [Dothideomycetes sp. NU457]